MAELLAAFDALREKHEAMAAIEFNVDGTYKYGINQVRRVACLEQPQRGSEAWKPKCEA